MINAFDNLCNKILTEKKAKKTRIDSKCWKGKKIGKPKTKVKNGVRVNNCVPESVTGEKKFTPCDHCDHPAKCEAAGKCLGGMVDENIRRMTGAPHWSRIRLDDELKNRLLDHGMNMAQEGGGDIRTIIMTLGALVTRNDKFNDNQKRAVHEYLGGEFGRELEAKLDAYDQEMFGEKSAKCTGPTKKASSTSKGKKYMKCVKSDSGGYKRIHWGQKGAKVTGKSGNTKRKKSFRARHKCSTAKSNTPRGQACKDW